MRIDAHQHFWQIRRGDYGWLTPELGLLYRDYAPADLAPLLRQAGIDATILVQAAATEAETTFLLETARATPFVAGVVGWTDFTAPDAAARIAVMAAEPLLVGLRPMVQDIADDDWLIRTDLAPAFDALVAAGLVFDALVLPRHLPRLRIVLDRHPDLRVVVDHCAKPDIRNGLLDPWRADIAAIAAHPNTSCKISGLVTEAAADWAQADIAPYIAHVLEVFGAARVIWGSDWPVVTLRADYARWHATAENLTAALTPDQRRAVFGGNARRVYLGSRGRVQGMTAIA